MDSEKDPQNHKLFLNVDYQVEETFDFNGQKNLYLVQRLKTV